MRLRVLRGLFVEKGFEYNFPAFLRGFSLRLGVFALSFLFAFICVYLRLDYCRMEPADSRSRRGGEVPPS